MSRMSDVYLFFTQVEESGKLTPDNRATYEKLAREVGTAMCRGCLCPSKHPSCGSFNSELTEACEGAFTKIKEGFRGL